MTTLQLAGGKPTRIRRTPKLAIRYHDKPIEAPCGVCAADHATYPGAGLFLAGTYTPVCDGCGERHDPDLLEDLVTLQGAFMALQRRALWQKRRIDRIVDAATSDVWDNGGDLPF